MDINGYINGSINQLIDIDLLTTINQYLRGGFNHLEKYESQLG